MRKLDATTKVPFAVSLTLVFGYSLLWVMVPPDSLVAEQAPVATTPVPGMPSDQLLRVIAVDSSSDEAERSVQ